MNVQTLPPGYKTAPWTPPETITGAMLVVLGGAAVFGARRRFANTTA